MSLEKSERYTMIGMDEDSKQAQIISFVRKDLNKLEKLCKTHPKLYKEVSQQMDEEECIGKEFICEDKKLVYGFRVPKKTKPMSEEEKKIRGERLQANRKPREKKPIT